jgi:hypothetical protein
MNVAAENAVQPRNLRRVILFRGFVVVISRSFYARLYSRVQGETTDGGEEFRGSGQPPS